VLLLGVALKLVPAIVTVAPTGPLVGLKLVIAGVTVKLALLVAVKPATATVIVPVVAPDGTTTTNCVVVAVETVAAVPLNLTVLLVLVELKFVPVIVTEAPTAPPRGLKLAIAGATVKLVLLVAVRLATVTVIVPVVAPLGTVTVN